MMTNRQVAKSILILFFSLCLYLLPQPYGLNLEAWHLFAIFLGTLLLIVFDVFPMGAASLIGITASLASKTLTFKEAFVGFTSPITWLILSAFFISYGLVHTGLGKRIAFIFIKKIGKHTIGIAYSIGLTELILAPGTPASTARTGGIIYPIVDAISRSFESFPNNLSKKKMGAYLIMCLFHFSVVTSTMFMTAMAANPFSAKLALELGVEITWSSWALYASIPGLLNLLLIPLVLYKIFPPEIKHAKHAVNMAEDELKKLGPMSRQECLMGVGFLLLMFLWVFGSFFNITAELSALLGLCFLLISGVVEWNQLLKQHNAIETFIWFGSLLALAQGLSTTGFTEWFGQMTSNNLQLLPPFFGIVLLFLVYFYTHYFFASCTAHVGAMFLPFLSGALALDGSNMAVALIFCYGSSLMGGLTHYGNGPAPVLFGAGYVEVKTWWLIGFFMSFLSLFCFVLVGSLWWYILGVF